MLNGQKAWITNAEHAGVFMVMANIDFDKVLHCSHWQLLVHSTGKHVTQWMSVVRSLPGLRL